MGNGILSNSLHGDIDQNFQNIFESPNFKRPRTWMCGVDEGTEADESFKMMINFRKDNDHLIIFHAFSQSDEAQASRLGLQPRHELIRQKYLHELAHFEVPSHQFLLLWEDRGDRTLRETLIDFLFEYEDYEIEDTQRTEPSVPMQERKKPDFLLFGYARHNFSADKSDAKKLGSVADLAMRSVRIPSIIVKKPITAMGPRFIIFAVNASALCKKGLEILLTMLRPDDKLTCLQIIKPKSTAIDGSGHGNTNNNGTGRGSIKIDSEDHAREFYERVLPTVGIKEYSYIAQTISENVTVSQALIDYTNEVNPDFLALSPRASQELSSITEIIIKAVNTNIVLCKNSS